VIEHKHANFLRHIADGGSPDEWEARRYNWAPEEWAPASFRYLSIINDPNKWTLRCKPKTVRREIKYPEPLTEPPEMDEWVWLADITDRSLCISFGWQDTLSQRQHLERRLLHPTKEAAVAHAKAMVGWELEDKR